MAFNQAGQASKHTHHHHLQFSDTNDFTIRDKSLINSINDINLRINDSITADALSSLHLKQSDVLGPHNDVSLINNHPVQSVDNSSGSSVFFSRHNFLAHPNSSSFSTSNYSNVLNSNNSNNNNLAVNSSWVVFSPRRSEEEQEDPQDPQNTQHNLDYQNELDSQNYNNNRVNSSNNFVNRPRSRSGRFSRSSGSVNGLTQFEIDQLELNTTSYEMENFSEILSSSIPSNQNFAYSPDSILGYTNRNHRYNQINYQEGEGEGEGEDEVYQQYEDYEDEEDEYDDDDNDNDSLIESFSSINNHNNN
ncbi:uncharacterized protein ASCRUDRAFT_73688, partial [Ascoidea rubescens DSM 1968]